MMAPMPTAKKDDTTALLMEIRDLMREQNAHLHKTQETLEKERKAHTRAQLARLALNGLIILFVAAATYVYYHTLVTSFPQ